MSDALRMMPRREALARFLDGSTRKWLDETTMPYQQLPSGLRARREQPEYGEPIWPEMPIWEWTSGGQADRVLGFLGLNPSEMVLA